MSFGIDANILLYASDRSSPLYERAARFVAECAAGPEICCLPWPAAMAYLRIATHPGIFAAPLAYALGAGLCIARKPGKLPYESIREAYELEYGEAELELHVDAVKPGDRVLVVDDLLATGGTADAVGRLVRRQGATLVGFAFVVELAFLNGARRLGSDPIQALVRF
jgi:predicted nucleic acid-binding protein